MSIHLQRFVDRVRGAEARGAKDFIMSMNDAKDLHADITRLLLELKTLRDGNTDKTDKNQEEPVVSVEISGGSF